MQTTPNHNTETHLGQEEAHDVDGGLIDGVDQPLIQGLDERPDPGRLHHSQRPRAAHPLREPPSRGRLQGRTRCRRRSRRRRLGRTRDAARRRASSGHGVRDCGSIFQHAAKAGGAASKVAILQGVIRLAQLAQQQDAALGVVLALRQAPLQYLAEGEGGRQKRWEEKGGGEEVGGRRMLLNVWAGNGVV